MTPTINTAAWIPAKYAPLEVGPAPYPVVGPGQIVVRTNAVAINPVDWIKQLMGDLLMGYVKYPFILGGDIAGQVVQVGPGVQRFQVGDRVMGCGIGLAPDVNCAAEGAFQLYPVLRQHLTALIPAGFSYEQASVVPLTLCTAAYGLFHHDFLNLDLPTIPARANTTGRAVIITGGASSVGSNAIQLAVSAGYEVYSTCSAKNFDYVLQLGAKHVLDYHDENWTQKLIELLGGKPVVGAFTVGDGAIEACTRVLTQLSKDGGDVQKQIAYAGFHIPADRLRTRLGAVAIIASSLWAFAWIAVSLRTTGVKAKFVDTKDLNKPGTVVSHIFADFLSPALAAKQFHPAPKARVFGKGLEVIQGAMDVQAGGVSASKIVVQL